MYVLFNVHGAIRYSDMGPTELGRPGSNYLFAYDGASTTPLKRAITGDSEFVWWSRYMVT